MSESAPILRIDQHERGLRLTGEIDASCVDALGARLDPLPGTGERVEIDLAGVDFIDSSGLRILIDAHQRAERAGRRLVIVEPSAVARRLFEIAGVAAFLHLEPA